MKADEKRLRILESIDRLQGDSGMYIGDEAIATEKKLALAEVRGHLGILHDEGRVNVITTSGGSSAFLSDKQRQMLREELESQTSAKEMKVLSFNHMGISLVRTLTGLVDVQNRIQWQLFGDVEANRCEGVQVQISLGGRIERRRAIQIVLEVLQLNNIDFIQKQEQVWKLDLDCLRTKVPELTAGLEWATGVAAIEPEIEVIPRESPMPLDVTVIRFGVYKEEYILEKQQRIFLSHKGADKPQVRRFFVALKSIGFDPWLDEDAMPAGTELERGILQGFKDSCAAIFFITPNFRDTGYLRSEINYAITEKRSKDQRFSIVTIVFADKNGHKGVVPDLLKQYVWKEPDNEIEALIEVLRALPIVMGNATWRS